MAQGQNCRPSPLVIPKDHQGGPGSELVLARVSLKFCSIVPMTNENASIDLKARFVPDFGLINFNGLEVKNVRQLGKTRIS